jgi:hypothetical protein
MNTVLLVPNGVAARNVILGPLARLLAGQGSVRVLHAMPPAVVDVYRDGGLADGQDWHAMFPYRETPLTSTLRYSLGYAHMYWAGTRSMRFMLNLPVRGSWRTRASRSVARIAGRGAASPLGIRWLDSAHRSAVARLPVVARYVELFRRWRPDLVCCADQRPPDILPAILAARLCGIATATFISSWDNLSSKGRMAASCDGYLVWSPLMRDELLRYYPDVAPSQVHVVGSPQFEPYADSRLTWSRDEFCRRAGCDPARPVICYSGGDAAASPEDADHARALAELIRAGRIDGNPQLLLRPAPVDRGQRFDAVRRDFPEIVYALPTWTHAGDGHWTQSWPLEADVQFLSNLTRHADVNVNFGSTMTLDFALHERPVVNVAFDVSDPPVFGEPFWEVNYRFEHYQPVLALGAARFARSRDALADHVNAYLRDPRLDANGRRRLVDLQVVQPIGDASERAVAALLDVAHASTAPPHAARQAAREPDMPSMATP